MSAGDEADLLEARELVEQHRQHHLVRLLRQVRQEEDLVGRRVGHVSTWLGGLGGLPSGGLDCLLGGLLLRLLGLADCLLGTLLKSSFNLVSFNSNASHEFK